ncbi:pimeloyl-ACP methyl ester carboxylesterase [Mumia flava]|uniref:Pimeloyl-ACP methyl ester carboxylesterase n=1 Tax=Mumia flava TaxID=1348852 RepID=A0A2M9BIF1_9ACTN|nr:alpha/beta hydrolase [Mumia flava]PJJ57721.1 pimeloyl-ACP methyl ester carboxylesterase [Mumia flava]
MPICHATGIAYDRAGPTDDAGTVVLIHAGIADRRMWDPQWSHLTVRHDTVRLDLRGFGESTARPTEAWAPYRDLLETLRALEVERADLVGCSYGAGVAVEAALAEPGRVASLLLCAPGGSLLAEETGQLAAFVAAEDAALERGDVEAAVEANLAWWVDGPDGPADRVAPRMRAAVATMQRRAFEITADWDDVDELEIELEPGPDQRYGEIAVPTLVLCGDLDVDAVTAAAACLTDGIQDARSITWPGTAHLPSMERPDSFLTLLEEWLEERGTGLSSTS